MTRRDLSGGGGGGEKMPSGGSNEKGNCGGRSVQGDMPKGKRSDTQAQDLVLKLHLVPGLTYLSL